tara:strand:+ start:706 stop:1134 length:429 start_codon:yes stop_codon:yes gene_type:complete
MIRYALDTSIMLRWFSQANEPDTARALRLRQEHLGEAVELVVLDQAIYELLHVLKESAGFNQEHLTEALASLEYMHIIIQPYNNEIARKAMQIACEHDISLYSACFVSLGAYLRCQAITSDERLYRKIASLPWTTLLSQLNI